VRSAVLASAATTAIPCATLGSRAQLTAGRNHHISLREARLTAELGGADDRVGYENMSKRFLQIVGVSLLIATVGIVSCQALFANSSGLGATPSSAERLRR
jgi:hypothetical protein